MSALLRESRDYAQGVGDTLKSQVYDALRHLAQGFLDYAPNSLVNDPETRKAIYDSSLILLYRLLFVLYAEARELLPVSASPAYRDSYSLSTLKQSVAANLDTKKMLLATTAKLWPSLKELFGIIDKGSPPLQVATFNGGLFDPNRHEFLDTKSVGDAHLQAAIDKLARVGGDFVDYRDLSVRHLGTIYEGLLEYHLAEEAPTPSPSPASERGEPEKTVLPPSPGTGEGLGVGASSAGWTIALLNDKGERKATGSYYTPDYIVKYIVEQTVGPMLDAAVAGVTGDGAKVEAVLQVNVLDPAMGSGHFLVETTEFIARRLIDLALAPGQDGQGESDLLYWKRRVAQSCVYGVDLNPLAVELAKLSLWLTTVAKDRPLSFLDHHLRAGNALVGARLADLQLGGAKPKAKKQATEPGQMTMMADESFRQSLSVAVGSMWLIEGSAAQTVAEVKQQEQIYETLRAGLTRKYSRLANLVTASHFGVALDKHLWKPLSAYALDPESASHPKFAEWAAAADAAGSRLRFFHWELEFPEVYFGTDGKSLGDAAGFDAVVGNPPYVRQEELTFYKPFFSAIYPETAHGVADLFIYFFDQGLRQLKQGGRLSYISSNSWLRSNYATPLRRHLRSQTQIEALIDLGNTRVFADAPDLSPAIHVVRRGLPPEDHTAQVAVFTRGEGIQSFERDIASKMFPVSMHDQSDTGWQLGDDAGRRVFLKLMAAGKPLGEVVGGQMYRGVLTGLNEAFIVDTPTRNRLVAEDPSCAVILKPLFRGEDLRPWYQEDEGRWMIVIPSGWTRKTYPALLSDDDAWDHFQKHYSSVAAHLLPFETAARKRQDKGRYWWELRPCDYYGAFDKPKVCWPDICRYPRFSWNASGAFVNDKGFVAVVEDPYILGSLQSRATWLCVSKLCVGLGERAGYMVYQLKSQFIGKLPIPDASDKDKATIGALAQEITTEAKARYALHEKVRHRLTEDFGSPGVSLNQKLTAWWTLDFAGLRRELVKVFQHDIPMKERDDVQEWFEAQKEAHTGRTAVIIARETDLNARVFALFGLAEAEIALIEAATKYQYGGV